MNWELYLMKTKLKQSKWKWRAIKMAILNVYTNVLDVPFWCLTMRKWRSMSLVLEYQHTHTYKNEMQWNAMKWNGEKNTKTAHQLSVRIMWRRNKVVCWNKEMQRIEMKTLNIGNVFIVCKWMCVCVCVVHCRPECDSTVICSCKDIQ